MTYTIRFSDVAEMEVENTAFYLMGRSTSSVVKWRAALDKALDSLTSFPARCALAPENELFSVEVRQMLFGSYRILFHIVDADGDDIPEVVSILHVRHNAQRLLLPGNQTD